jgi:SAM-dependent methyltransferase
MQRSSSDAVTSPVAEESEEPGNHPCSTPVADAIDQRAPNVARVYDWLIGGKDHYAADREAGQRLIAAVPGARQAARDNRAFLARVTRYLAAQAGITQFIDIGSGLPGPLAVHEVARQAQPGARVVYVDHDPVVVAHARALLADRPADGPPQVTAVEADLRYPRNLLTTRAIRDVIDFAQPVAILLVAVLHFLPDDASPHDIVRTIIASLAPGSYLALSHVTADHLRPAAAQAARAAYHGASAPGVPRSRDDIERFLDGLDLIPPGITDVNAWRPRSGPARPGLRPAGAPSLFYGGTARIPPR